MYENLRVRSTGKLALQIKNHLELVLAPLALHAPLDFHDLVLQKVLSGVHRGAVVRGPRKGRRDGFAPSLEPGAAART